MKINQNNLLALLLVWGTAVSAADYYVAQNGQEPMPPYDNLQNAFSNIQDAVDYAPELSTIWVDKGRYILPDGSASLSVLNFNKTLTLRSLAGASETFIDGEGEYRCVYIDIPQSAAVSGPMLLDGFDASRRFYNYQWVYRRG